MWKKDRFCYSVEFRISENGGAKFLSDFKPVEAKTQPARYVGIQKQKKSLKTALIVKF